MLNNMKPGLKPWFWLDVGCLDQKNTHHQLVKRRWFAGEPRLHVEDLRVQLSWPEPSSLRPGAEDPGF